MSLEDGMSIQHDAQNSQVIVTFRGKQVTLPLRENSYAEAMRVGEAFCRKHGWLG